MKNTFGTSISVTLFGESHGAAIGAVLDGIAPSIPIDMEYIAKKLSLRRPSGSISTARVEPDRFEILSGVHNGKTTGTPIAIVIKNENTHSADYSELENLARPSHADYPAFMKYHGFEDTRGGGHFSGRITAALVAAGAILTSALNKKGIKIATHIAAIAGVEDRCFEDYEEDFALLEDKEFSLLDESVKEKMLEKIEAARRDGDSVGGVLETAVLGLPAGVGEPWFDSLEGLISHAIFSVPAVKGIEFGSGFSLSAMRGSEANDAYFIDNGKISTKTNHNGGILGGISVGTPIVFRSAIKPTPSIAKIQDTVDYKKGESAALQIKGRHDPCIVHRARAVIDAAVAIALCDALALRFGTDWLGE